MRRAGFVLTIAILLSGCSGMSDSDTGGSEGDSPEAGSPPPIQLPPGCDATRPVLSRFANGTPSVPSDGPFVACLVRTGFASGEPTIGIAADGTVFIGPGEDLAGGYDTIAPQGILRSSDQGASWQLVRPTIAEQPTHQNTQDPYLYLDPTTDRLWHEDLILPANGCAMISWTDDLAETWEHSAGGCTQADHVTVFAAPPVTSPVNDYPNIVYRCASNTVGLSAASLTITCQKSLDGGRAWVQTGQPAYVSGLAQGANDVPAPCAGGVGHGVADEAGTIYLPRGHCGQPFLAISRDEGLSWESQQVSSLGVAEGGEGSLCVGLCVGSMQAHDAAVGVDRDGTIYYAWVASDRLARLTTSQDAGLTWSTPTGISPPGTNEVRFLELAVGAPGRVAFAMVASQTSPGQPFTGDYAATTWDGYLAVSLDTTSPDATFHSAAVNDPTDPLILGTCAGRCGAMLDFIDIRIAPDGTPWAPFVDGCIDGCGAEDAEALAGRLWGVSLWDDADPNGPYP